MFRITIAFAAVAAAVTVSFALAAAGLAAIADRRSGAKAGGNPFREPRKAFSSVLTLEGFGLLAFGAGMASCGVRYQALAAIAVGVAAVGAGFAAKALFGGRTRGRR